MNRRMKFLKTISLLTLLGAAILSPPALAFEMTAGAARTVITPPDPETPRVLVYGPRSEGVNHDLYARALSLNDGARRMVIVTYDLNCLDVATPILRVRVRDELGIDPAYLVLMATHNHAAPIQIVPDNFEYGRWLADKIFVLIQEAIANERGPVKLEFGSGRAGFVANMWFSKADKEVQLLKVSRGSEVVALFFNNPTHPIQASQSKIGVGHPGYAVEELERQLPGTVAMYADACGGDQFVLRGGAIVGSLRTVQSVGSKLARVVKGIADGPLVDVTGPITSRLEVISLPLAPPPAYEEALKLARGVPLDIGIVPYPHPDRDTNWIRALLKHYEDDIPFPTRTTERVCTDDGFLVRELPEPREFPCVYEEAIVASIGPMIFVSMQGEVVAGIGRRIKDAHRDSRPIMVSAYMGEHNLYVPTRKLVRMNVYQAKVIQSQYASPVGWSEDVEDEMVEGVLGMIERVLSE